MARPSIWQQKFNRDDLFVVNREFILNGVNQIPGSVFDKTLVTTRTLRQLFDQRKLRLPQVGETTPTEVFTQAPNPVPSKKSADRAYAMEYPKGSGKWFAYTGKQSASRKRLTKKVMTKKEAFEWCDVYNRDPGNR